MIKREDDELWQKIKDDLDEAADRASEDWLENHPTREFDS